MGWYESQLLPRIVDLSLRNADFGRIRAKVVGALDGDVLEWRAPEGPKPLPEEVN